SHWTFPRGPGTVWLWEAATGKELATLTGTPASGIRNARFAPDGERVLLSRGDFRQQVGLHLWDPRNGREELFLDTKQDVNTEPVSAWALSPDGRRVLLRFRRTLLLADARTGAALRRVEVETLTMRRVGFSPDGRLGFCCGGASQGGRPRDWFFHPLHLGNRRGVWGIPSPGGRPTRGA